MSLPFYRPRYDQIVSLVLLVLLGMAVVFLIDTNPNILRARLGGDLPVITISWLIIGTLMIIAAAGADVVIRAHPQMQLRELPTLRLGPAQIEFAPGAWILPAATIAATFAFFRLYSTSLGNLTFILGLAATGVLLLTILLGQHYTFDRRPHVRVRAQLALQLVVVLVAFLLFSAIIYARMRTLYSAPFVVIVGALLCYSQLIHHTNRRDLAILCGVVGLLLGEAMYGLNYWPVSFLLGGALLLIAFYTATSVVQRHVEGQLTARLVGEYTLFGTLLAATIIYVGSAR